MLKATKGKPRGDKSALPPSVAALTSWTVRADPNGPFAIVIPGATHSDRHEVLKPYLAGEWRRFHAGVVIDVTPAKSTGWLDGDVAGNLLERVRLMRMPPVAKGVLAPWCPHTGVWELLWNLVAVEEFVVEDPLRQMIDKPFYLAHDIHRALWEARFVAREHDTLQPVKAFLRHFCQWINGEPLGDDSRAVLAGIGIHRRITSNLEKLDVIGFLLALAGQMRLLERAIFLIDDLERALVPNKRFLLGQLRDMLSSGRRWTQFGVNPLGILLGFTGSQTDMKLLGKHQATLATEVGAGLNWAHLESGSGT